MKILIPLAEGFEEMEAVIAIDMLRRCGAEVVVAAMGATRETTGSRDIIVYADTMWKWVATRRLAGLVTFDALVIPGGLAGVQNMRADGRVTALARSFLEQNKLVAAICAAPLILYDAGLLEGRAFTCHPSVAQDITAGNYNPSARVVEDGNIITACGAGASFDFALCVGARLTSKSTAKKVGHAACVKKG